MSEPTSTLEPPDEVDAAAEDADALRASSAQNAPIAAVILAAGEGRRLGRPSKPLTRVAGVTLLERAVAAARGAGITRVLVVLGHAKEEVARFVTERGLDVELVENDGFSAGNGSSAAVGGQAAGDRFLLMMCDHLVEVDALTRIVASDAPFAVAVDTDPVHCDGDEATKVRVVSGAVVDVGRRLAVWDAVDAGIFLCDRSVAETAEHALAAGEGTWNAVKRRWIAQGRRLEAVDIAGSFWIDVDTPEDVQRAERMLVARAARKPHDGVISRRLNRPLSQRISRVLVRHEVAPTAITIATFVLTLVGAGVVALGRFSPAALIVGGLLVQAASVVDGCDGEVARAMLRTSPFGALLDTLLDRFADAALLTALAAAAGADTKALVLLGGALFFSMLVPYVKAAYEAASHAALPAARVTFGRDARMLAIAACAIALQPFAALVAVAVVSAAEAALRVERALRAARA
jgi:CDP-L-myo-inositol myo-inositolphosphotransferase